jgi:alkanesulfonate monooxygenase SsuD/methylene tetrahydromethanopterin reductase-like flavin-dependent oxidoreductase (luciferase family)
MLEFGVFDHLDRDGGPLGAFYEKRLKFTEVYDRVRFRSYHIAEHHATPLGMAPAPSVYLSAVAQRTRRLRFGPLVYLLPFYHPIRLIEEICMLDQMSGGRLEFGLGRGISPVEAAVYGHDYAQAERMMQEALQVILMALRGETIDFEGEFYHFRDVPLALEAVQKPHPPLWYGLHTPESAERAARRGYHMVCSDDSTQSRATAQRFREVWDATHGAGGAQPFIGVNRFIVVAPTDDEARAAAARAYPVWYHNFNWLYRRAGRSPMLGERPTDFASASAQGRGVAGSPATVTAYLADQLAGSAFNYLVCQLAFGDLTTAEVTTSAELFAEHVMPALRALKAREAA